MHTHVYTHTHAHTCVAQDVEEETECTWGQGAEKKTTSSLGVCRGFRKTPTTPSAASKLSSWQMYLLIGWLDAF